MVRSRRAGIDGLVAVGSGSTGSRGTVGSEGIGSTGGTGSTEKGCGAVLLGIILDEEGTGLSHA